MNCENEGKARQVSIDKTVSEIVGILSSNIPTVYLCGSVASDDFCLGWSDIDILVLTQEEISPHQAEKLVTLRQTLLKSEPKNRYYRSFEGGMLTLDGFVSGKRDRVVYWGTGGERITERYLYNAFSLYDLIENGVLLYGCDVRNLLKLPSYADLYTDVQKHYDTIRKYARKTGRSIYSFGWMLDIARCIYTLRTGRLIAKTKAGIWALENGLCPNPVVMDHILRVRGEPVVFNNDSGVLDYAETLGEAIQRFADVLECELEISRSRLK